MTRQKKGELLNTLVLQIILIAVIFGLFFYATADKINNRGVKQQVLEKQIALLIDSAVPGMSFEVSKENFNGQISKVEVKNSKIYVAVDGLAPQNGYPYFSKYSVSVQENESGFIVRVG